MFSQGEVASDRLTTPQLALPAAMYKSVFPAIASMSTESVKLLDGQRPQVSVFD